MEKKIIKKKKLSNWKIELYTNKAKIVVLHENVAIIKSRMHIS